MKRLLKIILPSILLIGLLFFWYWADEDDYFKSNFRHMTAEEDIIPWTGIIWTQEKGDKATDLSVYYRQHFSDTAFIFPRQPVKAIKLFRNIPMFGVFTAKILKQENNNVFLKFCNDTSNFEFNDYKCLKWSDAEYYVRIYDKNDYVVGKIYLCLKSGMTAAFPFCPVMKDQELSNTGQQAITNIINDRTLWE